MPTSISEDGPQLSAEGNFHQHINVFLVLERLVQPEKEYFRRGKQKKTLSYDGHWTFRPVEKFGVCELYLALRMLLTEKGKRLPRRFKLNLVSTATLSSL